jgi:hypothetical protein
MLEPGVWIPAVAIYFTLGLPRLSLGPTCTVGTGVIFSGRKRLGSYVYSSPSGDEVKNESNCTSVFPIRLYSLMMDNFACLMVSAIEWKEL